MAAAQEIRRQVRRWLDEEISFRQFEDWFVPVAGAIAAENDPEAEALVDDIDMSLSEYSDGVLTGPELRAELENAIRLLALSKDVSVSVQSDIESIERNLPSYAQLSFVPARESCGRKRKGNFSSHRATDVDFGVRSAEIFDANLKLHNDAGA